MNLTDIQTKLAAFARPEFTFDADAHEYQLNGKPLVSWSKWIEQYANPFPEQQAAAASASKRGITAGEVLAEWQWSRDLGTLVHAWIEDFYGAIGRRVLFPELPTSHPDVRLRCQKFQALYTARLAELVPLALEWQVHHEAAGVAGMLDFTGHHPARQGVLVADWKTNGKFDRNNQITRFTKRFRGPLADLYETKENLYSLQNSFYRVLLEEAGIPTCTGALIWLPPGDEPAVIIQALDYRQRIRSLLFS